jgi:hypothetical protein
VVGENVMMAVASPNEYEALIGCNQLGKEESGSSLPLSGTMELPSRWRTQLKSRNPLPPSTAGCVRCAMAMDAYTYSLSAASLQPLW